MTSLALPLRVYEFWLLQYRRVWRASVVGSVINPVFYLGALGVGLGTLVNRDGARPLGVSYLDFVAPGMLAATAMQIAAGEATWPVMGSFRWTRQYFAMASTPLGVRDIVTGHQLWMTTRVASTSVVYLAVISAFGGVDSFWALLALPAAVLVGLAFSAPLAAYAATRDSDGAFIPIYRFGILPLFLFSGTFFPVSRLPAPLEWVAYATPLWHGVDLCRELTLGTVDPLLSLGHVAYLSVLAAAGVVWAQRTYARRLRT
jgi:lipooligosaccharide transport system permease protein